MQFDEGWYAYRDDEPKLGPFESKVQAALAGLKAWSPKVSAPARIPK
jgi:hypothetical protein